MSRFASPSLALTGLLLAALVDSTQGQAPSPAESGYAVPLAALRDSLAQTRIELSAFQRDLPLAGPETVVERAAALHRRCEAVVEAARSVGLALGAARAGPRDATDELAEALDGLGRGLSEQCVRGLSPTGGGSRADTLRAWGPHRVAQIERLLTEYDRAARRFGRAVGGETGAAPALIQG